MKTKYPLIIMPISETMSLTSPLKRVESISILDTAQELKSKEEYKPILVNEPVTLKEAMLLASMQLITANMSKNINEIIVIDSEKYSEEKGNLFLLRNYNSNVEPSLLDNFDFKNKDFNSVQLSTPKKNRKQNNRKVKKRKKANNGK